MSDALCGPSNPLQQFKQQTSLDRTLQQDRLSSRQSPGQGFRSTNPNAGLLDPEFEAFQAGVPPSELPHLQPFQRPPQQYSGPVQQAPSWAADFQQMHISSPPPLQQQRMSPAGSSPSNWAQGFRDHFAQTQPRAQTSASSPQQFQQMARYGGMNGFQSGFAPTATAPTMQSKGKEPVMEQFDEAAFERAFDQARDDMMGEVQADNDASEALQEAIPNEQEPTLQTPVDGEQYDVQRHDYQTALELLEQHSKGRLRAARDEQVAMDLERHGEVDVVETLQDPHQIHEKAVEEQAQAEERAREDDDALAATAQELLEKVQHNQTDKFRNSQFLGLMRKLRDREVKVEGDKMVETNVSTSHSTAETQTLNSPSAVPRFDNSEQRPAPLQQQGTTTVDTRPYEYGIPYEEQDHDLGRGVNPQDGQEVVDMLNRPGPVTDDIASYDPEPAERYGDSTNGNSSPYLMTRFPPGMRTVV